MDWNTFLIISHIIGTVLGVGGATFAEIFSIKALRDGLMEPMELSYIRNTVTVLRVGLFILVLSGFGFLLLYRLNGVDWPFFDLKFWAKMTVVGIIAVNAVVMQLRIVPMSVGSAISLTSWYTALVLGIWHMYEPSFLLIMFWYIVAIIIVFFVLAFIKKALGIDTGHSNKKLFRSKSNV